MTHVLMIDDIGGNYTIEDYQTRGLGGSECEIVLVAHELAKRGHEVTVANGVTRAVEIQGVTYVPTQFATSHVPSRAIYFQRTSRVGQMPIGPEVRVIVRANDIYFDGYDVHRAILESGRAALVANTHWQANLFAFAKEKIVVAPMLDESPVEQKIPGLFVYASGPMKGYEATIEMWKRIRSEADPDSYITLKIVSPGWGKFADYSDIPSGIEIVPVPTPLEYRRWIAKAEGLFMVSTMAETFCCAAALAERSQTRTHILCKNGLGGIPEAIVNRKLVTENDNTFIASFFAAYRDKSNFFIAEPRDIPNRLPSNLVLDWEKALSLVPQRIPEISTCGTTSSPASHELLYTTFRDNLLALPLPDGVSVNWRTRCAAIVEDAKTKSTENFLCWSYDFDICDMECFSAWYYTLKASRDWGARWNKLTRKAKYGKPHSFASDDETSPICIQHAFHLYQYEKAGRGSFVDNADVVIEVGGGHGNFARMLRLDGWQKPYVIIDLPHAREFQRLFLGLNDIPITTNVELIDGVTLLVESDISALLKAVAYKRIAFVSTFGLSETPISFREKLFPTLHAQCTSYLIAVLGWPMWESIDNRSYFTEFMRSSGTNFQCETIDKFDKSLSTMTRYLFARKDYVVNQQKDATVSVEQTFADDPSLASNKKMGTDEKEFFGDFFSLLRGSIAPGGSELGLGLMLFSLAASTRSSNIVEIGRFKGFSTLALAAACRLQDVGWKECKAAEQRPGLDYARIMGPRERRVVSIDPFPTKEADELLEQAGLTKYVTKVSKRSQEVEIKDFIDLLFIDGSHTLNDVRQDVQRFVPRVRPGGYFVMHDYYGWFDDKGNNGSPVAKIIAEDLEGFDRVLIDTAFASLVIFRKTHNLTEPKDLEQKPAQMPARADGRPTVGLVMIAKGPEVNTVVARAIASARRMVDCITLVCDAPENIADVARQLGADVFIRQSPKVDFDKGIGIIGRARNEALAIAEHRTDYILVIDADDWIEGNLPEVLDKDAYEVLVHDGGMKYPRIQLFKSGRGGTYKGICHEHLEFNGSVGKATTLKYMRGQSSYGYQDQDPPSVKYMKHARQIQKWLIDHPEDSRMQFYLARSYHDAGQLELAILEYEKRISMIDGWTEERFYSAFQIGLIRSRQGKDPTVELLRAHEINPLRAEPLVVLAQWHRDDKQRHFSTALCFARLAAEMPYPENGIFVNEHTYQFEALAEWAICAYWGGRIQESLTVFEQVLKRVPYERKAWAESMITMCKIAITRESLKPQLVVPQVQVVAK